MFNYIPKITNLNLLKVIIILLIIILYAVKINNSILLFFIKNKMGRLIFSLLLCISAYYETSISILFAVLYVTIKKK